MKVAIYANAQYGRSMHIAKAMHQGFRRHNVEARIETRYDGRRSDLAVAYGWTHERVFRDHLKDGKHFLYIDLGYWHRKPAGAPRDGYHKVSLDDWCPSKRMARNCPGDRWEKLGIALKPWRSGETVVVAGMSAKSAYHHGLAASQWESATIGVLKKVTAREIVYRPKPSWDGATPIKDSTYSPPEQPLADVLARAHAVVTHHSNTAIDALVDGLPFYTEIGVARPLSTPTLAGIDQPRRATDEERLRLLRDVAYCQWTPGEMAAGKVWDHFRGLL